ncbi:MAG: hypothetical protein Kow0099_07020 [Candidatus Abyssubacteria bacterium]
MTARKQDSRIDSVLQISNVGELKRLIAANAIATGNTFAFHDVFAKAKEFSEGTDSSPVTQTLLSRLQYLLPDRDAMDSPGFRTAMELVERHGLSEDVVPAALLEETAKEAISRGKFAYAEDAYKLLGVKKEMVALYAQTGEQFLRENKPVHAAMSFFVAASIDQPIGPHYQYLGTELHALCRLEPQKCITNLPVDALVDAGIEYLLGNEPLADRLTGAAQPDQKKHILGALAVLRDTDLKKLVENLRAAAAEISKIQNGKPDDYSPIAPILLGRPTGSQDAWQYMKELCFEHPVAALCVCVRSVRDTLVLVPALRAGTPLIEEFIPAEFWK